MYWGVTYEDHDWAKDTNRTLCITTYQIVKEIPQKQNKELLSGLGKIPPLHSKLGGPGVSIIKMSFFQKENGFRHLNETLFLMSPDELSEHFMVLGHLNTRAADHSR